MESPVLKVIHQRKIRERSSMLLRIFSCFDVIINIYLLHNPLYTSLIILLTS